MSGKYDDILHLEHPTSKKHPRMSMNSRAGQFAPFSALVGFGDAIDETSRLTDRQTELDGMQIEILNTKLRILSEKLSEKPLIEVEFFVPDDSKAGGEYRTVSGRLSKLDSLNGFLILETESSESMEIRFENMISIEEIPQ